MESSKNNLEIQIYLKTTDIYQSWQFYRKPCRKQYISNFFKFLEKKKNLLLDPQIPYSRFSLA